MDTIPPTGARRSLLSSAATALGFAHLAGLAPTPAATGGRQEPTIAAPAEAAKPAEPAEPAEARKHDERDHTGKFKPKDTGESDDDEDDDEDDEDEEGDDESDDSDQAAGAPAPVRAARRRERARCSAIMGAPDAARYVQLAAHLAFNTNLPRSAAVAALKTGAPPSSLAARMASQPNPSVPAGAERPTKPGHAIVGAAWDAAFAKHRR